MIRQAVIVNGTHDHAFPQETAVNAIDRLFQVNADKIASREKIVQAHGVEGLPEPLHARLVEPDALCHMGLVAQCCLGGDQRHGIDIEGLPHAVHEIGEIRV